MPRPVAPAFRHQTNTVAATTPVVVISTPTIKAFGSNDHFLVETDVASSGSAALGDAGMKTRRSHFTQIISLATALGRM